MNLRLWDFACGCGKRYEGYPVTTKRVPSYIRCSCGEKATWTSSKQNHIHTTNTKLNYGKFDPQFGCVVESYGHKKQLLKQHGMVDVGGPERMDDIMNDTAPQKTQRDPNVFVADSIKEIMGKVESSQYDRRRTGSLRGRQGQDPESGLIEGWHSF